MPALENIDAQKSFSSQRPWCGLRFTIRTRQRKVPPLHPVSLANLNPFARIQGAKFITKQVSRATQSGYVNLSEWTGAVRGKA